MQSHGVADQIDTRFGALDRCLAAAVRHGLDVAATSPALAPMNAVHLRLASMADIIEPDFEFPEPPTYRWREFMVELFGQNEVGTRRSPVSRYAGKPNAVTLDHIKFGELYELDPRERSVVHDLLASAGAFIVAEPIALHDIVDRWELSGRDGFVVNELDNVLQHASQIGVRLSETARTGAWLDLLFSRGFDPPPVPVARSKSATAYRSPAIVSHCHIFDELVDHIVLMVEPMDDERRRSLTARAIATIRESMRQLGEDRPAKQVVVVSATNGQHSEPLPLPPRHSGKAGDDGGSASFDHMLDEVARAVDTFGQADGRVATLEAPTIETTQAEQHSNSRRDACCLVSQLRPTLLIVLMSAAEGAPELLLQPDPSIGKCFDANRIAWEHWRSQTSVVLLSEGHLEATYIPRLLTHWSAVGTRNLRYQCLDATISFEMPAMEDKPRPSVGSGQLKFPILPPLDGSRLPGIVPDRSVVPRSHHQTMTWFLASIAVLAGNLIILWGSDALLASLAIALLGPLTAALLSGYQLLVDSIRAPLRRKNARSAARSLSMTRFHRR